ncbi:hypothetical protein ACIO14_01975 [Nocardia fluminea]|uniref:hypothetical protein n=1 Tax=Nocardia fluminea TaxID=134984 RepID=UPI00382558AF
MFIVLNLRGPHHSLRFDTADGARDIIAPLTSALSEGQRTGEFGDFDPTVLARLIRDSIDGIAAVRIGGGSGAAGLGAARA